MAVTTATTKIDPILTTGAEDLTGPLTETVQNASHLIWDAVAANLPRDLHWQFVLVTLIIALSIWLIRDGHGSRDADGRERKAHLLQFLLPKDIYTHVSARVDIWLWVTERIMRPLWVVGLLATVGPSTESSVIDFLQWTLGATPAIAVNYGCREHLARPTSWLARPGTRGAPEALEGRWRRPRAGRYSSTLVS